ncbi:MAG: hypothetical protein DSZ28_09710 [Thiothrix sp.]|nr:MAG: hypothetical protein DSZ28_09710 [Thiothrix sp.]
MAKAPPETSPLICHATILPLLKIITRDKKDKARPNSSSPRMSFGAYRGAGPATEAPSLLRHTRANAPWHKAIIARAGLPVETRIPKQEIETLRETEDQDWSDTTIPRLTKSHHGYALWYKHENHRLH